MADLVTAGGSHHQRPPCPSIGLGAEPVDGYPLAGIPETEVDDDGGPERLAARLVPCALRQSMSSIGFSPTPSGTESDEAAAGARSITIWAMVLARLL